MSRVVLGTCNLSVGRSATPGAQSYYIMISFTAKVSSDSDRELMLDTPSENPPMPKRPGKGEGGAKAKAPVSSVEASTSAAAGCDESDGEKQRKLAAAAVASPSGRAA